MGPIKGHKGLIRVMVMFIILVVNIKTSSCTFYICEAYCMSIIVQKSFLKILHICYEVDQGNLNYSSKSHWVRFIFLYSVVFMVP